MGFSAAVLSLTSHLNSMMSGAGGLAVLALLFAIVFAETGLLVGFFLPGDSLLFTIGVFVSSGVIGVPLWLILPVVIVAAIAGDQLAYLIGRRAGPVFLRRPDGLVFSKHRVEQAQGFFDRHGSKAVVLARFVPVARTFTPILAGIGQLSYRRFTTYNVVGAVLWAVGVTTAGLLLGGIGFVRQHIDVITLAVVAASLIPTGIELLRQRRSTAARGRELTSVG